MENLRRLVSLEKYPSQIFLEVIKRIPDKFFPCQDFKKFSSPETCITNRIKRNMKIRNEFVQLWVKFKSRRALLKYKNEQNEIKMENKMAKRRDAPTKLIIKIPRSFSVILGKWRD